MGTCNIIGVCFKSKRTVKIMPSIKMMERVDKLKKKKLIKEGLGNPSTNQGKALVLMWHINMQSATQCESSCVLNQTC